MLRDPATNAAIRIRKDNIESRREVGSLMPEGLAEAMTFEQRRDLVRFLLELGSGNSAGIDLMAAHVVEPAPMPIVRAPLNHKHWPSWQLPVNRNRLYDFYAREAEYFRKQPTMPMLLRFFYYQTPQYLYYIIPIAVLVSTLVTIGVMTKNSELIVVRACGMSLYRSAAPLVLLGCDCGPGGHDGGVSDAGSCTDAGIPAGGWCSLPNTLVHLGTELSSPA